MNLINQSVRVVYPSTPEEGINELKRIEIAGRNCWRSEDKITEDSYKTFINNLRKRGHESPLEFGEIMFEFVTSRDVLAEITRHRLASFAVESQRYVNESKDDGGIKFIMPMFYMPYDEYYWNKVYDEGMPRNIAYEWSREWEYAMEMAENAYNRMITMGMRNQDARKVLPNSTACTIMMKVNIRELIHIYALRSSPAAYPEMRELMRLLKIEVDKVLPGFLPEEE